MTDDLTQRASSRNSLESRARPFDGAELREDPGGSTLTFTGYASVFDKPYEVNDFLGSFSETIRPGSFRNSLAQGADVPFKVNHDGMTLARTKSGTMQLSEDTHGLHVQARLDPSNPQVQALRSAMSRGDIDEMSFAFRVTDDAWSPDWLTRSISGADINKGDVSAVNYGANPATAGASIRGFYTGEVMTRAKVVQLFSLAMRDMKAEDLDPETKESILALAAILGDPTPDIHAVTAGTVEANSAQLDFFALRLRALSL